jgi:alpha-L-arabinofuranosidase
MLNLSLEGRKIAANEMNLQILTHADLTAYNQVGKPETITPVEKKQKLSGKKMILTLDALSLTVARIPLKK